MSIDKILFLIMIVGVPLLIPLLVGAWLEGKRRLLNTKSMFLYSGIGYSAEGIIIGMICWPLLAIVSAIIFCGLVLTLALVGTTAPSRMFHRKQ